MNRENFITDFQDSFRDDARFKILRLLEKHPDYSQRDLARALGLSLGGVNFCLRGLIQKGFVKVSNFRQSDNKLRYVYVLTPSGVSERAALTHSFLQRRLREYEALQAEIEALRAEGMIEEAAGHSRSVADGEGGQTQ